MAQKKPANIYFVNTKEELHQTLDTVLKKVEWGAFETLLKPIHNKTFRRFVGLDYTEKVLDVIVIS